MKCAEGKGEFKETHHSMNNSVFTKQDDFPGGTDKPLPFVIAEFLPNCKFLNGSGDGIHSFGLRDADILVLHFIELNRSSSK